MKLPELDARIAAHANAVIAGDENVANSFVTNAAVANARAAIAPLDAARPVTDFELLACAKIGQQFIAKTRFFATNAAFTLLIRWKNIDGSWMIADAEDISTKRSPWSDIAHYETERKAINHA